MLFGRESEHFTLAGMLPSADHVCDCLAEAIFAKLHKRRRVGVAVSMQQLNTQDERIAISDLAILLGGQAYQVSYFTHHKTSSLTLT